MVTGTAHLDEPRPVGAVPLRRPAHAHTHAARTARLDAIVPQEAKGAIGAADDDVRPPVAVEVSSGGRRPAIPRHQVLRPAAETTQS